MGPTGPAARVMITPDLAVQTLTDAIHQGKADALLEKQDIVLDTGPRLRLWPHRHGTDGFFAAVLENTL